MSLMIGPPELEIVDKLLGKGIRRLDVLSVELNRTERTLRYSLRKLNDFFKRYHKIDFVLAEGQYVELLQPSTEIINLLHMLDRKHYHMSVEERIDFCNFCYIAGMGFTMEELAEFMNISLSTLKQTMLLVKDTLNKYGIALVNVHGIGLRVKGKEREIRKRLASYLYRNFHLISKPDKELAKTNPYLKKVIINYLADVPIGQLTAIMNKYEAEYAVFKNDEFYKLALADLIVIYKRGLGQISLNLNTEPSALERQKTRFLQQELFQELNIKLEESEFYDFAGNIGGVSIPTNIPLDILLIDLLNKLIDRHIQNDKLDLSHPRISEAIGVFKRHFHLATERVKKDIRIENPLLGEIKRSHKILFNDLECLLRDVEKQIGSEFSGNEIGYFTILIENILSAIVSENKQIKNVIVLCGLGYGTSKLLSNNIQHYFKVNIIDVIPYHRLDQVPIGEADLIITTVPLADKIKDTVVVQVSPLMTDEDLGILRNAGLRRRGSSDLDSALRIISKHCEIVDEGRLKQELALFFNDQWVKGPKRKKYSRFLSFVQPRNIAFQVYAANWKEAVQKAGLLMVKNGSVDITYIADMIQNIETYGPYMVVGDSLLPHAKNKGNVFKTDFGLITLVEPVELGNKTSISTILSFSSVDEQEHIDVLIDFMSLIENDDLLGRLREFRQPRELIQFIENNVF